MERRPILVIEDDDATRTSIEFALADEGYPVVTARDGAAALDVIKSQPPALILLDLKMPIVDGRAFATAYRQQPGPHAPIVVMTAAADGARWEAEVAAEAYLAKPFDLDRLLDLVAQRVGAGTAVGASEV